MFCKNCGNKLNESSKFCAKCGYPASTEIGPKISPNSDLDQKWWLRFVKVVYIVLYIPLPFILIEVWTSNTPYSYYDSYLSQYYSHGSYGEAFWYSLITLIIYLVIIRLIKITFLYIVFGKKPEWRKEFKRLI
jgi:zinc-ribbon domain